MQIKVENSHNGLIILTTMIQVPFNGMQTFTRTYNNYTLESCKRRFRAFVRQEVRNYIGYHSTQMWRNPTADEVKFGVGATHYKTFQTVDLLNDNCEIKQWTVCPTDGLRYYRSRN